MVYFIRKKKLLTNSGTLVNSEKYTGFEENSNPLKPNNDSIEIKQIVFWLKSLAGLTSEVTVLATCPAFKGLLALIRTYTAGVSPLPLSSGVSFFSVFSVEAALTSFPRISRKTRTRDGVHKGARKPEVSTGEVSSPARERRRPLNYFTTVRRGCVRHLRVHLVSPVCPSAPCEPTARP